MRESCSDVVLTAASERKGAAEELVPLINPSSGVCLLLDYVVIAALSLELDSSLWTVLMIVLIRGP